MDALQPFDIQSMTKEEILAQLLQDQRHHDEQWRQHYKLWKMYEQLICLAPKSDVMESDPSVIHWADEKCTWQREQWREHLCNWHWCRHMVAIVEGADAIDDSSMEDTASCPSSAEEEDQSPGVRRKIEYS
jgi:hypothetical protein